LDHGDGDRACRARADAVENARIAERLGVALLLQVEPRHVHAAGSVDGQDELQIDLLLRLRKSAGRREERCGNDPAKEGTAHSG
jgi:hypothetical protein